MHQWVVLKNNIKIYIKTYIKTAPIAPKHVGAFISVINQLDAQHFLFTLSLFHASTCFEPMCSSSGGQNCIKQPLALSHI